MRRFYDLRLAHHRSPIFAMTFTVMHKIDRTSPLWDATPSSLAVESAEIVVTVTGIDEITVQPVHARTSYLAHEVLWDHRFADVFIETEDRRLAIDYRLFHETEPIEPRTTRVRDLRGQFLTAVARRRRRNGAHTISLHQTVRLSPDFAAVPRMTRVFRTSSWAATVIDQRKKAPTAKATFACPIFFSPRARGEPLPRQILLVDRPLRSGTDWSEYGWGYKTNDGCASKAPETLTLPRKAL